MEIALAYVAGLLTLINPCVLPVLPIVLATALQVSRWGPVMLALGMSLSFVAVGLAIAVFGQSVGLSSETVAQGGALLMVAFGLILLVPRLSEGFAFATAGVSARTDARIDGIDRSAPFGQFLAGALLGVVWVPCIGPTLGGAIALASAGESLLWATAIMTGFAAGISTIVVALGYGAQNVIRARRDWLRGIAARARPAMGLIFVLTGLALFFQLQRHAEIWLIETMPYWIQDLSVRF